MPLSTLHFNNQSFKIAYRIAHLDKSKDVVILHGWGSSKELMEQAFIDQEALEEYRLIFIDLPGFGKSDNNYVLSTADYASILNAFFNKMNIQKDVIIGHSFGGKVGTLLEPKSLVLLSSAGIVLPKPLSVRAKIYLFKILKLFGLKKLRHLFVSQDAIGMSDTMYETFKKVVDEDFEEIFKNCPSKTLIFWGKDDEATPLICGEKMAQLFKDNQFFPLEGDHFFFLQSQNAKAIAKEIERL